PPDAGRTGGRVRGDSHGGGQSGAEAVRGSVSCVPRGPRGGGGAPAGPGGGIRRDPRSAHFPGRNQGSARDGGASDGTMPQAHRNDACGGASATRPGAGASQGGRAAAADPGADD